jgi:hypothetical protein
MSIKRSKQRSQGSGRSQADDDSPGGWGKPPEPEKTWAEHLEGKGDDAFLPYAMSTRFTKGQLLAHPKFGKGVVVGVEGARIEVLFEEGAKKLGHAQ